MTNHKPKDKEVFLLNPITGKLDLAIKFNADRIVTHSQSYTGNDLVLFDPTINQYVPLGDLVVTDNEGNVVVR